MDRSLWRVRVRDLIAAPSLVVVLALLGAGGMRVLHAEQAVEEKAEEQPQAKAEEKKAEEKKAGGSGKTVGKKTAGIAVINLDGSIPDGVGQGGLLADVSPHLHRIVERLDKAATDPRVKGVLVAIGAPDLG
ncbi:MAG: hypothetical protein WCJ21_12030, partial [Planctomycetota bacterium]